MVLGANGHLGSNIVQVLLGRGERVRASIRGGEDGEMFERLGCEVVRADIMDKQSLERVMEGADTVFIAAAVYKTWAKDPQKEIIDVNIRSTENILEAALKKKVKTVVYASSALVLERNSAKINETTGWNKEQSDPYTYSKIESEKVVRQFVDKYGLRVMIMLPTAMIGPNFDGHLTPSTEFLFNVIKNKVPFDPGFFFNYIDIRDASNAFVAAAQRGRPGRYILAQEKQTSSTEVFRWANEIFPDVKIPAKAGPQKLYVIATAMEIVSALFRQKPLLTRNLIKQFSQVNYGFDIGKARTELGFEPTSPKMVVQDALRALKNK